MLCRVVCCSYECFWGITILRNVDNYSRHTQDECSATSLRARISSSCENPKSRTSYVHRCQKCRSTIPYLPRIRDHMYVANQEALRYASVLFLSVVGLRRLHGIMKSKPCCPVLVRTGQNPLQILRVKMSWHYEEVLQSDIGRKKRERRVIKTSIQVSKGH
jgi:hypothetical protein